MKNAHPTISVRVTASVSIALETSPHNLSIGGSVSSMIEFVKCDSVFFVDNSKSDSRSFNGVLVCGSTNFLGWGYCCL